MLVTWILHPIRTIRKAIGVLNSQGLVHLIGATRNQLRSQRDSEKLFQKNSVIKFWEFVNLEDKGSRTSPSTEAIGTINWFIPYFGKGSGGHTTIFRFIHLLEKQGYDCRIVIVGKELPRNARIAKLQINEWFFPLKAEVFLGTDELPEAEFGVATEWKTAYYLRNFGDVTTKCYFVQDFEPWFFPVGSESVFAAETYNFGFHCITAGEWLGTQMKMKSDKESVAFHFSYDAEIFWPAKVKDSRTNLRVLFYARPPTPRRGFELGMLALTLLHEKYPDMEVFFLGWDISGFEIPFRHVNFGVLPNEKLGEVYREASVALVLSLTNVSLLPVELMASGIPIVSNKGEWLDWQLNETNSVKTEPTPRGLADGVSRLHEDENFRSQIVDGALQTAISTSWEREGEKVAKFFSSLTAKRIAEDS